MPIQALACASSRVRGAVASVRFRRAPQCSVARRPSAHGSVQGPIRNRDAVPPASVSRGPMRGPHQSKDRS